MITIRQASGNDFERICYINKVAFGYEYPLEKTKERLSCIINTGRDMIYVACENDNVIGYIHGSDYECTYNDSLKNIMAIAVLEEYRGKGVGRLLIEKLEEWAREEGSSGVRLVSGMNRQKAHEFYLHLGYKERKTQKNFIKTF